MVWSSAWGAALLSLVGCASSPSTGRSDPPVVVAGEPRVCAATQGRALDDRHDIDGDGVADLLTHDDHSLRVYVRREGCFEGGGTAVLVYPIDHRTFVRVRGGIISVERRMIHGDMFRQTFRYDGGRLLRLGEPGLVPGPRATSSRRRP